MPLPPVGFDGSSSPRVVVLDYLRVLYRRRWLALAVLAAVVVSTAIYTYRAIPIYEARVSLLIDFEEPNVVDIPQVLDESPALGAYIQTQQELLVSRALVQRTVKATELWKRPGFGPSEEAAIAQLRGGLEVTPIRGTRMVLLRFRATNPQAAAEAVNAHARQYVEQSLERRFLAAQEATEWLDRQLAEERTRVEQSEAALQAFREEHDAVSLEDGQNIVVQKLADLNAAVTRAKTARIEREAEYREISAAGADPAALDSFPAILSNGFIGQLKSNLATLQREYAQLSETLGDLHPSMVEKRTAIETTEKRLATEVARVVDSVRKGYEEALAEERSLMRALDEQKREALSLNRRGIEYAALEREAESVRLVYQSLLQRAKETSVARELRATNVQVIDLALPPGAPVLPRTTFNMVLSLFTGTLLGIGAAFGVELLDDRIKAPSDLVGQISAPFLGLVPEARVKHARRVSLARREVPKPAVEAFRSLRTNVFAAVPGPGPRSILVASAAPHEGKTHVASNLAIALAQAHHRVLLVDADMRRPRVHEQMDHRLEPGLSSVLAGTAPLPEALQQSAVPGLTVLTAGNPSDHAPELLGSTVFAELLAVLQEHFAWVIIDSPPALTVTDATIVAPHATGTLLVVGSGMTRAGAAQRALEELQRAGGRVIGTVLNRADVAHHPFYFAPYSSGEYLRTLDTPIDAARPASTLLDGRGV